MKLRYTDKDGQEHIIDGIKYNVRIFDNETLFNITFNDDKNLIGNGLRIYKFANIATEEIIYTLPISPNSIHIL